MQLPLSRSLPLVDVCSPSMNAEIRSQLVGIIERHNAIIDLCSDLTGQFTVIVLMHFLSAAFVLCSTILDIMLVSRQRRLKVFRCFSVSCLLCFSALFAVLFLLFYFIFFFFFCCLGFLVCLLLVAIYKRMNCWAAKKFLMRLSHVFRSDCVSGSAAAAAAASV